MYFIEGFSSPLRKSFPVCAAYLYRKQRKDTFFKEWSTLRSFLRRHRGQHVQGSGQGELSLSLVTHLLFDWLPAKMSL